MNFPENRYKHCHNVGLKMYKYAKEVFKWNEEKCNEMFVLGVIHDIGYELDKDAFGHDIILSNTLKIDGYKYYNEIKNHSKLQHEYDTPEMRLLYFGDMTVDGTGNWCTFEERLKDLEIRYGKDSEVYIESKKIAVQLTTWGFFD